MLQQNPQCCIGYTVAGEIVGRLMKRNTSLHNMITAMMWVTGFCSYDGIAVFLQKTFVTEALPSSMFIGAWLSDKCIRFIDEVHWIEPKDTITLRLSVALW